MMSLLEEATKQRQVRNRILIHLGNKTKMEELLKRMRVHENYSKIEILRLQSPLQTKLTTLIVDRKLSLEIEVKYDTKDNPDETIGLARYSNSEATFGLLFLYLRPCGCNRNCIAAANFEIVSYYVITTSSDFLHSLDGSNNMRTHSLKPYVSVIHVSALYSRQD